MLHDPHPIDTKALSGPALRAFFQISRKWGLDTRQERVLLGMPSRSTLSRWKKQGAERVSNDTLERISYVLGIYKALHILFPESKHADAWINCANTASMFGGGSALDRMLGGQVADLFIVRQYLDAQRIWS